MSHETQNTPGWKIGNCAILMGGLSIQYGGNSIFSHINSYL
jgi:hypothetical protein